MLSSEIEFRLERGGCLDSLVDPLRKQNGSDAEGVESLAFSQMLLEGKKLKAPDCMICMDALVSNISAAACGHSFHRQW